MVEEEAEDGAAGESRVDFDHECFCIAVSPGRVSDSATDQSWESGEGDHGAGWGRWHG